MFDALKRAYREIPYKLNTDIVPSPQTIFISINSVCNLRCKMCDIGMHNTGSHFYKNMNTGEELSLETIGNLIDEVKHFDPMIAIISTEPLLHKNIIDIIKLIRTNGLKCQLTTNGLLLPEYAEALIEADLNILYVSLDGPEKIHNNIRGNESAWSNAEKGMVMIRNTKYIQKKKRPYVRINYTVSGYNYDKLVEFIETAPPCGHIDFSHMNMVTAHCADMHNAQYPELHCSESSKTPDMPPVEIQVLWDHIQSIKQEYSSRFVSFTPDIKAIEDLATYYNTPEKFIDPWNRCKVPWNAAQIFSNGDIGVSTRCYNIRFGNIKYQKFADIWNGDPMTIFRKDLKSVGAYPACSRCCGIF